MKWRNNDGRSSRLRLGQCINSWTSWLLTLRVNSVGSCSSDMMSALLVLVGLISPFRLVFQVVKTVKGKKECLAKTASPGED